MVYIVSNIFFKSMSNTWSMEQYMEDVLAWFLYATTQINEIKDGKSKIVRKRVSATILDNFLC